MSTDIATIIGRLRCSRRARFDPSRRSGGRRYRHRRVGLLDAIDHQTGDVDLAVCVVGIAFAISTKQGRARSGNLEESLNHPSVAQIAHQQVACGIDVWPDVMSHLRRIVANAYPAVEAY